MTPPPAAVQGATCWPGKVDGGGRHERGPTDPAARLGDDWSIELPNGWAASCAITCARFNVKDFARLVTEWGEAGTRHAGCLLIVGIDHAEFGVTLRAIDAALTARPEQDRWVDYAAWATRGASG